MYDIPKAVDFVRNELARRKVSKKESARIILMAEEVIGKMIETASDKITITVYGFFDFTGIWLSAKGTEFSASDIKQPPCFGARFSLTLQRRPFFYARFSSFRLRRFVCVDGFSKHDMAVVKIFGNKIKRHVHYCYKKAIPPEALD